MTEERSASSRKVFWGIRGRILFWYVAVLAAAIAAAVLVNRQVLIAGIDTRIDEALVQESEELRFLARGRDPTTGEPFDNRVDRIFDVFLQRNVPTRNETFVTFIDGSPFERSLDEPVYRLDLDARLVDRWGAVTRTQRGQVSTPVGTVEYLAVPVKAGNTTRGVFVAAIFRDRELATIAPAIWGAAGVGLATLLVGSTSPGASRRGSSARCGWSRTRQRPSPRASSPGGSRSGAVTRSHGWRPPSTRCSTGSRKRSGSSASSSTTPDTSCERRSPSSVVTWRSRRTTRRSASRRALW
jgi:hypothetical protein